MNQNARNLLTYAREWARLHWWQILVGLVLLVVIAGQALAADTVTLTPSVGAGNVPTLTWSAPWASGCTASGGWSGSKASSGSQTLPAITATTTYNLSCTGAADTKALLEWTAPTQNTDGSALTDLAGFRIYYGTSASNLSLLQAINSASTRSFQHNGLTVGTHYYAVTAVNAGGVESARSATGSKTVTAAPSGSASVTLTVPRAPTLTVQQTTAYDVRMKGLRFVLNQPVGTVPLGTVCHRDFALPDGYYRVDRKAVTLATRTSSAVIVAQCG